MSTRELGLGLHGKAKYFIYRDDDPKDYGHICPECSKRYGVKHPRGEINITRCKECPSFDRSEAKKWFKRSQG